MIFQNFYFYILFKTRYTDEIVLNFFAFIELLKMMKILLFFMLHRLNI